MKPDNILADWEDPASSDRDGRPVVSQTLLSDLDSVYDMKGQWLIRPKKEWRHFRLGNVRWRAPEMQTGQGIGQFSDVFAYGLVVSIKLLSTHPYHLKRERKRELLY
jgi:serine/threonine protein kinase